MFAVWSSALCTFNATETRTDQLFQSICTEHCLPTKYAIDKQIV